MCNEYTSAFILMGSKMRRYQPQMELRKNQPDFKQTFHGGEWDEEWMKMECSAPAVEQASDLPTLSTNLS